MALPLRPAEGLSGEEEETADGAASSRPAKTSPDGSEPIQWQVVAKRNGLMQAAIVAGRLQAAGVPARAWQDGAGLAIGLTVGLLGTGYVAVPEEYTAQAEAILAVELEEEE